MGEPGRRYLDHTMAGTYSFTIEQGATFSRVMTWKDEAGDPINLTGYSARMQFRARVSSDTPFLSLTSEDSITLGGAAGTITITIDDATTAAITEANGVYDLELESSGGVVTRLLEGSVKVSKEVTR